MAGGGANDIDAEEEQFRRWGRWPHLLLYSEGGLDGQSLYPVVVPEVFHSMMVSISNPGRCQPSASSD